MSDSPRFSELSNEQLSVLHSACESFEQSLTNGQPSQIEEIVADVDSELKLPLVLELLAIEIEWNLKKGQEPNIEDYEARFTEFVKEIRELGDEIRIGASLGALGSRKQDEILTDSRRSVFGEGTEIGERYRLVRKIGEGGMGEVWTADQTLPVKRTVAIKLIKFGMDSRAVLARFEQERQTLAMMDHPNIAQMFDAGVTDQGQPYFVMEFVNGRSLGTFCDQRKLTPKQRLELFVPICQAVQHAHQKGIVHRDLKPSNIVVSVVDEKPVPIVIDFGVAKATGPKLTEESIVTQLGTMVGTLAYMSPEQAGLTGNDVDTRTDIYSLGVILYELLSGLRPIDCNRLASNGLAEMVRVIQEEEPSRPSTKLSSNNLLPSIAAVRGIEPRKLPAMLKGELDWVVMKCIDKQRERRYQTANALARDIERYLLNEPVEARPASTSYRCAKFIRRNRGLVIAGSLMGLLLIGGIAGTSYGLFRAEAARRIAVDAQQSASERETSERKAKIEATRQASIALASAESERNANAKAQKRLTQIEKSNEILGSIFVALKPRRIAESNRPLQVVLVEKLNLAVQQLEGDSIGDPLMVAKMQMQLGRSLLALSEPQQAKELFEKARLTRHKLLGPQAEETFESIHNQAMAILSLGEIKQAIQLLEETLEMQVAALGSKHPMIPASKANLAQAYIENGEQEKAISLMKEVVQSQVQILGERHPKTLESVGVLAVAYHAIGELSRAMKLHEKNLEGLTATLGEDHPSTVMGNV